MTPDALAAIRARHQPRNAMELQMGVATTVLVVTCRECFHEWPCDAARLLPLAVTVERLAKALPIAFEAAGTDLTTDRPDDDISGPEASLVLAAAILAALGETR